MDDIILSAFNDELEKIGLLAAGLAGMGAKKILGQKASLTNRMTGGRLGQGATGLRGVASAAEKGVKAVVGQKASLTHRMTGGRLGRGATGLRGRLAG